jgi:hypothetical protein
LAQQHKVEYDGSVSDYAEGELDPWEKAEQTAKARPRARPAEFNRIFRAVVSEMAHLFNNLETAYAMHKTLEIYSDDELRKDRTSRTDKFRDAQGEFRTMTP